jgi:hypothetical protein
VTADDVLCYCYSRDDSRMILEDLVLGTDPWYRAWVASRIRAGEASCDLRNRLMDSGFLAVPASLASIFHEWFLVDMDKDLPASIPEDMQHFKVLGDAAHSAEDDVVINARWVQNCEYDTQQQPSGAFGYQKTTEITSPPLGAVE